MRVYVCVCVCVECNYFWLFYGSSAWRGNVMAQLCGEGYDGPNEIPHSPLRRDAFRPRRMGAKWLIVLATPVIVRSNKLCAPLRFRSRGLSEYIYLYIKRYIYIFSGSYMSSSSEWDEENRAAWLFGVPKIWHGWYSWYITPQEALHAHSIAYSSTFGQQHHTYINSHTTRRSRDRCQRELQMLQMTGRRAHLTNTPSAQHNAYQQMKHAAQNLLIIHSRTAYMCQTEC